MGSYRDMRVTGTALTTEAVFPQTQVQLCVVHLVRHALSFVSRKDRKAVADDLKEVY